MADENETASDGPRYAMALVSGLTVGGRVLVRGDVVELPAPGTDAYAATVDRNGTSWVDDLSAAAQFRRWSIPHLIEVNAHQGASARSNSPTFGGPPTMRIVNWASRSLIVPDTRVNAGPPSS